MRDLKNRIKSGEYIGTNFTLADIDWHIQIVCGDGENNIFVNCSKDEYKVNATITIAITDPNINQIIRIMRLNSDISYESGVHFEFDDWSSQSSKNDLHNAIYVDCIVESVIKLI